MRSSLPALSVAFLGFLVVLADAVMSFFGSMGCDCGYNAWLNDHTDDTNKGQVGAALAAMPIFGTVVGTVVGGMLVNAGNPTVGSDAYAPAQDNYQLLFWGMGLFVIAMGLISLFLMKDAPGFSPPGRVRFGSSSPPSSASPPSRAGRRTRRCCWPAW